MNTTSTVIHLYTSIIAQREQKKTRERNEKLGYGYVHQVEHDETNRLHQIHPSIIHQMNETDEMKWLLE